MLRQKNSALPTTIKLKSLIHGGSDNSAEYCHLLLTHGAVNALRETPKECAMALAFMLAGYPASVLIERAKHRQASHGNEKQQVHAGEIELQ
jgi:hypothetical protein